jgi:hypothetical protein
VKRLAGALLVLAVMPALPAPASAPSNSAPTDPSITNGSAQRKLNAARHKWSRHGPRPRSYAYRVRLSCFCTAESVQPHTFVVRNGKPDDPPKGWSHAATAKRLFKLVQQAIHDRPDHLFVRYRKKNGLLKELSVDPEENTADEEYAYFVDRFHRLR